MLFSDLRYDFVRTWFTRLEDAPFDRIEGGLSRAREPGPRRDRRARSVEPQKIVVKRAADMRYVGQEHAVTVDLPLDGVRASRTARRSSAHFDAMHAQRYGTSAPDERAEIVSLRTHRHRRHAQAAAGKDQARQERARQGRVHRQAHGLSSSGKRFSRPPTYRARCARAGNRIDGPALIEEHASTTVLLPGDTADGRCVRQSGDQRGGRPVTAMASRPRPRRSRAQRASRGRAPAQSRSRRHRDRAQRRHRGDRGDEDQPHAHRLQHHHLRGARFHHRAVHARGRDDLDRHRPADVHPRHGRDGEGQDQAFRHRRTSSPGDIYVTNDAYLTGSHLNHVTFTLPIFHQGQAGRRSPAAWRIGSISAACSAA